MDQTLKSKLFWITLFSIAMGFLEGAVVVYLRELYYPNGFQFPLKAMSTNVSMTEIIREISTIIMLLSIGFIASKKRNERFAWLIYSFAIWDIFYYVFLYLVLRWPDSLLTWDVLFLIPVMWIGPVVAPIILSILMIILSLLILYYENKYENVLISKRQWGLILAGSLIAIISFCEDFYEYILLKIPNSTWLTVLSSGNIFKLAKKYIPNNFNWWLYLTGVNLILLGIVLFFFQNKTKN